MVTDFDLIMDPSLDKFKDECGVFGIFSDKPMDTAGVTYYGLYALQHRGQESAGIAVSNGETIGMHKGLGLITDAFKNTDDLHKLKGNIAIGHVRYSTTGANTVENSQPLVSNSKIGTIAMAHNGNLVNADVIRELLEDGGHIFHTSIDTEVIATLLARGASKGIEKAVVDAMQAVKGSFALVIMTKDKLIGARDPHGIRPLCIGRLDEAYILSSESCALDAVGAEFVRDVKPGEIVVIDKNGVKSIIYAEDSGCQTCCFEYIYFARPDSQIDGLDVYTTRVKFGEQLYREHKIEADLVVPVPDSGIPSAIGYSKASGIPYGTGFIKNRYVGRTFISPSQEVRERAVAVKLNPLKVNVQGKRVILIDDSIVRGTTSKHLVEAMRRAGAKEVHLLISSPPVKFPCYFGIDTAYRSELMAANHNIAEMTDILGADSLGYLSMEGMYKCFGDKKGFCIGCLNGVYPVATPIEAGKEILER
ncbi:MAG: amidophosphoribosyltransferase [Clostridium sp.]|jgi:amidophosphoribosyltransferase|nr:amidophosphoribosyltransferase [Clostridium sp.]